MTLRPNWWRRRANRCALYFIALLLFARTAQSSTTHVLLQLDDAIVSAAWSHDLLCVVLPHEVRLYATSEKKDALPQLASFPLPKGSTGWRAELFDVDHDGKPEVLITVVRDNSPTTLIMQQRDGTWQPRAELWNWYVRVVTDVAHPDTPQLWGQHPGNHSTWLGRIQRLEWQNGALHEQTTPPDLPRGAQLFAVQPISEQEILLADEGGRLRRWQRSTAGPWRAVETLPARMRSLSATTLRTTTPLLGNTIEPAPSLPLLPIIQSAHYRLALQHPRLGHMIGRDAYWNGWRLVSVPRESAVGVPEPAAEAARDGAVLEWRAIPNSSDVLAVVQSGRSDPFSRAENNASSVLRITP